LLSLAGLVSDPLVRRHWPQQSKLTGDN